jgi:LysM domain
MQNLISCANIALHFFTLLGFFMRKIISLICILLPILTYVSGLAYADELVVRENAPDRYVVVRGDTLWDISNRFFKDPWKWPQIWGLNKDAIKDPHWIYPGNVIVLDPSTKTLHLGELPKSAQTPAGEVALVPDLPPPSESVDSIVSDSKIQKLSPKIRVVSGEHDAIPSIPASVIGAFLSKPLVIENDEIDGAPTLIGSIEQRALLSFGDTAFATGMPDDKGPLWQLYRPGKKFIDPDTDETLGYEAIYLGDASIQKYDAITTLKITKSVLDIQKGDNLIQSTVNLSSSYIPRAPSNKIRAKVISIYGGVDQGGQNSVITLNKGTRDGLENGHVLALYKESEASKFKGETYTLPALRYGLVFVFRTFDKVSYALVMQVQRTVQLLDSVETP